MHGGEGMMRQIIVESEIRDIQKLMLSVLVKSNRSDDAFVYCLQLAERKDIEDIFLYLGKQLAGKDHLPDKPDTLTALLYTALQIGRVSTLVDNSQQEMATVLYDQIDTKIRKLLTNRMILILLFDRSWNSFHNLLDFAGKHGILEQKTLLVALNQLSTAKKDEQIVPLLTLIPQGDESLQASLALSYIAIDRLDLANTVFADSAKKNHRKWETVAVSLKKD
jgi:hypothetical protein